MVAQKPILLEIFNPNIPQDRMILEILNSPNGLYTRLPQDVLENLGIDTGFTIPYLIIDGDKLTNVPLYRIGVKVNDRECVTLAIPSEEKAVGYLTLAELGLRFKTGEISQIVTYSDPLIYTFIFEMIPDTYESIYTVEPARKLYHELLILYDDWFFIVKDILQEWRSSSFVTAIMSIFLYNLNSMIFSIFTGMLPHIAFGMRLSLEALVAGYFGDLNPKFRERYPDPLVRLERTMKRIHGKGFRKFCDKYLREYFNNVEDVVNLWNALSFKFIHSIGWVRAICISHELPSIAMGAPFSAYYRGDEKILSQLTDYVKRYREVFNMLYNEWVHKQT
ncbi:MAG: hypothetical protein QXO01_02660 [Nitrososphaerota archaeon]